MRTTKTKKAPATNKPKPEDDFDFALDKELPFPQRQRSSILMDKLKPLIADLEITKKGLEKGPGIKYHKKYASTVTYILNRDYHSKVNGRAYITRKIDENYRGVWRVK